MCFGSEGLCSNTKGFAFGRDLVWLCIRSTCSQCTGYELNGRVEYIADNAKHEMLRRPMIVRRVSKSDVLKFEIKIPWLQRPR